MSMAPPYTTIDSATHTTHNQATADNDKPRTNVHDRNTHTETKTSGSVLTASRTVFHTQILLFPPATTTGSHEHKRYTTYLVQQN